MKIDEKTIAFLGQVILLGQIDGDDSLWALTGRATRVPRNGYDEKTPGVFSLRTLVVRSDSRNIKGFDVADDYDFVDPALLDFFASAAGKEGQAFTLNILGLEAKIKLVREARTLVQPAWEHPGFVPPSIDSLAVPPYVLAEGSLTIVNAKGLENLLPDVDLTQPVELRTDGVVYTAAVVPPDGGSSIPTRVRLTLRQGKAGVGLLNPQPASSDVLWRQLWLRMNAIGRTLRVTAWARLSFSVDAALPELAWPAKVKNKRVTADWADVVLQAGIAQITLADQPLESQVLGPEQVLELAPAVRLQLKGGTLVVSSVGAAAAAADAEYSWNVTQEDRVDETTGGTTTISVVKEFFSFAPMLLVHEPTRVRGQLALAYGRGMPASSVPVVGFMQLENGWLEVPVEGDLDTGSGLPAIVERTDAKTVRGSFLLGNRRHEFHVVGEVPASAPWSLQLDEPPEYFVEFTIDLSSQPRLAKARIGLSGFALESRGLAWMANSRPDANDALPMASDHPDAYFDVVLRRCVGAAAAAPFGLSGLVVEAQQRPGAAWNDAARAQDLQPVLAQGLVLHLNPSALAPNAPTQRAWLRHPTLPSMQVMCSTRSDPTSTLPHASRSLTPFERFPSPLALEGPASMLPRIAVSDENSFLAKLDAKKRPEPLVALTLPGIELLPLSPSTHEVSGDFEQPLYLEPHALAVIPPPDKDPSGPGQGSAPPVPPVITALEPERLEELRLANWALRERAATQDSSMFPRGEMGKPINVTPTTLAPPFSWAATIQIDPKITIKGSRVTFGRATFSQKAPVWSDVLSGDSLLEGPRGRMLKINGATVSLDPAVGRVLVGWSVREEASGGYVWDARGVGWAVGVTAQGRLISRALQLRDPAGHVTQGSLIATQEAISVSGVGGVAWRFAFTDLPMAGKAMASEAKLDPIGRFAAAASGWTWSLWAPGEEESKEDRVIQALPVSITCRFMPSALASVVLKSGGALESVAVEGVLVAGNWSRAVGSDALRRVTLQMKANTQGDLSITNVKSVHADGKIVWDLERHAADASGWGGVAQLIGTPVLRDGVLWMDDARLVLSIFQRSFELALPAPIDTRQTAPSIVSFPVPSDELGMHVSKIELDLANARVLSVTLAGSLRKGVDISVEHRWDEKKSSGKVQWFGNEINWDASVDGTRDACVLTNPSSVDAVTIFPGVAEGRVRDGLVALSIGAGVGPRLEVQSHFCELRFLQRGELTVAHLLQSGGLLPSERDTLRFDGNWTHDSLIGWSNIQRFEFPDGADSVPVEFACPPGAVVRHQTAFELFDHRIPGANIELALNAGIRLKAAGGEAPPTWVVEATHTLTWPEQPHDTYRIRALHALQLWSAEPLAKSLDAMLWTFGFVPGYIGGKPTSTFPRPGVQRIHLGYIGLFDKSIATALKTLDDSWVILAGMTTLVRGKSINYGLLQLPFIGAVCTPSAASGVQKLLMPPPSPAKGTKLKMSRYDVLDLPVTTEASSTGSPADLVEATDLRAIPFAQDLLPSSLISGAAMSSSWFAGSEPYLPGWHVEQIQRPGRSDKKDPLPHPFARAAVMLAMLRKNAPAGVQETVSVLTRYGPRARPKDMSKPQRLNVTSRSVKLQPILETQPKSGTNPGGDLIIGGEGGLVALPVARGDLEHEDPKHLVGLAIRQMVEPAFLIIRRAGEGETFARCDLPAKQMDPLDFSVRALRAKAVHTTDGHLTWPDAFTGGHLSKADLVIAVDERAPEHFAAPLALAAVSGRMRTTRPMGLPFELQGRAAREQTHTVWIEERDRVAFIRPPEQRADAAPWMQDTAVSCMPLVPSTKEIARAIVQMDPSLGAQQGRRFQTYLPVVADTLDFSSRAGAYVEMGVRVLSSRNSVHRQFEQADGGTGITRSIRRPRPVPLPENGGHLSSWRRTVGWWRNSGQSCQALLGAWDSLSGPPPDPKDSSPPEHREIPRWSVLLGKAVPFGLTQETRGAAPVWRGAVTVTCSVWDEGRLVSDPALVVLGLLTAVREESLRTGLRTGARWIDFAWVKVLDTPGQASQDRLVFVPPAGALPVTDGDCVFECGLRPRMVDLPIGTKADLELKLRARETLDRADFRMLTLPVRGPVQGRFPIPLVRRTIFFSDPAFDLRLSRIEPLSVNQAFNKDIPDKIFNAWIDRQSVTPNETAVVCVTTNWRDGKRAFFLTARTIHNSDGYDEALGFDFGAGGAVLERVPLAQDEYYALPTSVLRAAKGGLLRAGDTLMLQVQAAAMGSEKAELIAKLLIPIKSKTVLPPPQAMYSLVVVDTGSRPEPTGWCSAHSALPTPECMSTDVVKDPGDATAPARLIRRGIFKWVSIDPVTPAALRYSILKAERTTESTHIPETIEGEVRL